MFDVWLSIGFIWALVFILAYTLLEDRPPNVHLMIIAGIGSIILLAFCAIGVVVRSVLGL